MKYIKKVILENFQSHKHTIVDFNNRLNVIVGASDSGKTAILRGIKWALYNDPSGDYFIREGESQCSVTIIFSDHTKVKRYRSKSKNAYYLYDEYDNELKFEGFGTNVPEEILEATGIKKILLDKNISKSINISNQLEGAFLLSEKGSIRASSIGYLVGVDIIDDALKETLREVRNISNNKRNIDSHIVKLEKELSQYDYLEELTIKTNKLEDTLNKIKVKEILLNKYKSIHTRDLKLKNEKSKLDIYMEKLKDIYEIEILLNNIELNNIKYKQLTKQKSLLETNKLNIQKNKQIADSLKNLDLVKSKIDKISLLSFRKLQLTKINLESNKMYCETETYKYISNTLENLEILENKTNNIYNNIIQLNTLSQIKKRSNNVKSSLYNGKNYINKLEGIDIISKNYLEIENKLKSMNLFMKLLSNYNINKKSIAESNKKIKEYKKKSHDLSNKYKDILLKAGTCPLCFSHIDNKKANSIMDEYK
ncbi:MAG TPA: AAA family ATPase [Tissierellaceae bacterium]|nr:AAA family ATPase [Tissierellaceae bacterium]